MKPELYDTPRGRAQYNILRSMFTGVVSNLGWLILISNLGLGTTGAYISLLIANLDKILPHLKNGWQWPVMIGASISALLGIWIQITSEMARSDVNVEEFMLGKLLPVLSDPEQHGIPVEKDAAIEFIRPVLSEFIDSRPLFFRNLARAGMKKGMQDLVYVSKTAAGITNWNVILVALQYVS